MAVIGAHVSISGGFEKSIDRALEIGADCLQTFASSPRSLKYENLSDETVSLYLEKKKSLPGPHFFHGIYLINLANEKPSYVKACVQSLVHYQKLAGRIGGEGTIFHIGSHKGRGFEVVKSQVVAAVIEVLKQTPNQISLFLENAAGHSGIIGDKFAELAEIIRQIPAELQEKIAVCLDTQHCFASGYEVRTGEGIEKLLQEFEEQIGISYLKVIHANDSKSELGSRRDRHENIGEGLIGMQGFRNLLSHPVLKKLPFILEVPGKQKKGPGKKDIDLLRELSGFRDGKMC